MVWCFRRSTPVATFDAGPDAVLWPLLAEIAAGWLPASPWRLARADSASLTGAWIIGIWLIVRLLDYIDTVDVPFDPEQAEADSAARMGRRGRRPLTARSCSLRPGPRGLRGTIRLVFQFPASITSVVDAPRLVSSDASPTRPEWAVTRSTPAARAAA